MSSQLSLRASQLSKKGFRLLVHGCDVCATPWCVHINCQSYNAMGSSRPISAHVRGWGGGSTSLGAGSSRGGGLHRPSNRGEWVVSHYGHLNGSLVSSADLPMTGLFTLLLEPAEALWGTEELGRPAGWRDIYA